ncbi:MAG: hypothetical protein K6G22_07640 [Lachnospiraceae bacterium]|nr:hypothetical protein [Lachnospiraceae bacterium]
MQVGGIGAGYVQPYIYNTNSIKASSMNKIQGIGDDLLTAKTDFSALTEEQQNVNPLKRGETADFMGILQKQMEESRQNASRVMAPPEDFQAVNNTQNTESLNTDLNQYTQSIGFYRPIDLYA